MASAGGAVAGVGAVCLLWEMAWRHALTAAERRRMRR